MNKFHFFMIFFRFFFISKRLEKFHPHLITNTLIFTPNELRTFNICVYIMTTNHFSIKHSAGWSTSPQMVLVSHNTYIVKFWNILSFFIQECVSLNFVFKMNECVNTKHENANQLFFPCNLHSGSCNWIWALNCSIEIKSLFFSSLAAFYNQSCGAKSNLWKD